MPASPYHHGHLREALVEEAVAQVRAHGPDGLALRELARRVGVSHNAAYRHFADREALMAEVAAHAMRELVATMRGRVALIDDDDPVVRARLRLAGIGRAYVEFALAEAGLFRVAFSRFSSHGGVDLVDDGPYEMLSQALDGLVEVGFLSSPARVDAEVTCWAAVHGFATLALDGPLALATPADLDHALDGVLEAIDRSYAATTGADVGPLLATS